MMVNVTIVRKLCHILDGSNLGYKDLWKKTFLFQRNIGENSMKIVQIVSCTIREQFKNNSISAIAFYTQEKYIGNYNENGIINN